MWLGRTKGDPMTAGRGFAAIGHGSGTDSGLIAKGCDLGMMDRRRDMGNHADDRGLIGSNTN